MEDITQGRYIKIKGVVPRVKLIAYLHQLKAKIGDYEFVSQIAIADSDDVPAIFGRVEALELLNANFVKGKIVKLSS